MRDKRVLAQIKDWNVSAVVAVAERGSRLGRYLTPCAARRRPPRTRS